MNVASPLYRVNNSEKKAPIPNNGRNTNNWQWRRWKFLSVPYMLSVWNKSRDNILYLRKECTATLALHFIWYETSPEKYLRKKKRGGKSLLYSSPTLTTISYNFYLWSSFLRYHDVILFIRTKSLFIVKEARPLPPKISAVVEIYEARWTRHDAPI